ncbi:MAG: hypothetical protein IJP26_00065 [Clostridia bacterium]|nr:hypothetical protein [Clostridia bacterium]
MKNRFVSTTVGIILAMFLVYQLFASLYNPVTTEIVTQFSTTDGINITGVIIREETLVKNNNLGTMHFEIEDSERVSKGGVIANIYGSDNQSHAATEITKITKEIKNIEEIQKYNDLNAIDLELINSKIYGSLNNIIKTAHNGNYTNVSEPKEELLTVINRKQIATGVVVDFSNQLTELNNRLNLLNSQLGTPVASVVSEKSGYFLSVTDGYEGILTTDKLDQITPEFLEGLSPESNTDSSVIGKLVSDYTWYIAASVTVNESLQFKEGENLKILTNIKTCPEINVTVERVNMSLNNERAVIIFSCNEMNSELSLIRTSSMTVVKNTYSGLKVSSSALRFKSTQDQTPDGTYSASTETGVYVVNGMTAKFVPVNIVYSTAGYAICEDVKKDGNLKLYDEIIVKGKNIYDGKIID